MDVVAEVGFVDQAELDGDKGRLGGVGSLAESQVRFLPTSGHTVSCLQLEPSLFLQVISDNQLTCSECDWLSYAAD
jgi:hypothetical protein